MPSVDCAESVSLHSLPIGLALCSLAISGSRADSRSATHPRKHAGIAFWSNSRAFPERFRMLAAGGRDTRADQNPSAFAVSGFGGGAAFGAAGFGPTGSSTFG